MIEKTLKQHLTEIAPRAYKSREKKMGKIALRQKMKKQSDDYWASVRQGRAKTPKHK